LLAVPVVLATVAVGMTASIVMQIGLLAAVLIGALAAELPHVQSPFHRRSAPTRTTSLGR
jgi:hypothetical protein